MSHFSLSKYALITLATLLLSWDVLAQQMALVTAEEAIVFADARMTVPVGFIRKGRKVRLGPLAPHTEAYQILVSGKVAFIHVHDVDPNVEVNEPVREAKRFRVRTEKKYTTNYSASYYNFSSETSESLHSGAKSFDWDGLSIKGEVEVKPRLDFSILLNFMGTETDTVAFRAIETGLGLAYRVYDGGNFSLKTFGQFLLIPFASYAVDSDFRVNGFGLTAGAGILGSYRFGSNWAAEAFGGFYYTKLSSFDPPSPYGAIDPSFTGSRLGMGLSYHY